MWFANSLFRGFLLFLTGCCVVVCITALSVFELFIIRLPAYSFDAGFITKQNEKHNQTNETHENNFFEFITNGNFYFTGL